MTLDLTKPVPVGAQASQAPPVPAFLSYHWSQSPSETNEGYEGEHRVSNISLKILPFLEKETSVQSPLPHTWLPDLSDGVSRCPPMGTALPCPLIKGSCWLGRQR